MKQRITTLPNGLRIVTSHMADAQSVTVSIIAGVGSRYEDYEVNGGVSHFLEHLLFKGTKKWPGAKIISEKIDAVGGYNNAYTSNDMTNYFVKVPHQHAPLAMDILADMIRNPLLDPVETDRERNVILEEMNVYRDDPSRYVGSLLPPLLWPNQPLGQDVIGSEKVIREIPHARIVGYHKLHYRPDNLVVAAAGKVDHDAIVTQAKQLLGGLKKSTLAKAARAKDTPAADKVGILAKDTAQTHLIIGTYGYKFLDRDNPAAQIVTAILGRGMSSRLFINVRERKGLAYSVNASIHSFADTGVFDVYAGVNLDKTTLAIEAIMKELELICSKKVAARELNKAKNQLKGGLQMSLESNFSVADRLATQLILVNKIKSVEKILQEIDAVTPEDVLRVARKMLDPQKLRMAIITPNPEPAAKTFRKLTGELS
ncbi:MAG TPA: pitrilysin family protein [Candidatus Dormibacteraeota bacterium]|nr:pitrilysin family protein [Candidatus Dormibacteraeota bacterium]